MRISSCTSVYLLTFMTHSLRERDRVDSMNVRDDTEIDWKLLPDENWNIWSAHSLQRRWLTMKRGIKGFEEMSHAGEQRHCRFCVLELR